jgi:hypothetical protein
MRSFLIFTPHPIISGDKIEKNEMGGACSAFGVEERRIQGFGGDLRERDHLGYPGVDSRVILRWIFRKWNVSLWTGSSWLRIGTGGWHL